MIIKPHNPNLWAEIMKDTAGFASFKPAVTNPPKVAKSSSVTVDKDAIRRLRGEGVKPTQIALKLSVARSTVYETLKGAG